MPLLTFRRLAHIYTVFIVQHILKKGYQSIVPPYHAVHCPGAGCESRLVKDFIIKLGSLTDIHQGQIHPTCTRFLGPSSNALVPLSCLLMASFSDSLWRGTPVILSSSEFCSPGSTCQLSAHKKIPLTKTTFENSPRVNCSSSRGKISICFVSWNTPGGFLCPKLGFSIFSLPSLGILLFFAIRSFFKPSEPSTYLPDHPWGSCKELVIT